MPDSSNLIRTGDLTDPALGRLNMVIDGLTKDLDSARSQLKTLQAASVKSTPTAQAAAALVDNSTIKANSFGQAYLSAVPISLLQPGVANFPTDTTFEISGGTAQVILKATPPEVDLTANPMKILVVPASITEGDPTALTVKIDATGLEVDMHGVGTLFKITYGTPMVLSVGSAVGNGNLDLYAGGSAYLHADSATSKITVKGNLELDNGGTPYFNSDAATAKVTITNIVGTDAKATTAEIGTLTLTNALAILQGGTGATTASGARANIGAITGSGFGSGSATLAKLTTLGSNGSLGWDGDGLISSYVAPT